MNYHHRHQPEVVFKMHPCQESCVKTDPESCNMGSAVGHIGHRGGYLHHRIGWKRLKDEIMTLWDCLLNDMLAGDMNAVETQMSDMFCCLALPVGKEVWRKRFGSARPASQCVTRQ